MPTPLCEQGELRPRAIHTPVDFLVRERTDSLPVGGSTGSTGSTGAGQTLSADALRACVSVVREPFPVKAHSAAQAAREALEDC
jgi:dihydrodipicolinate synthase/N-acetylneuraminate lyase